METLAITGGNSPLKGAIPLYVPDQKWKLKALKPGYDSGRLNDIRIVG